jgi:hypothetical protein
MNRVLKTTVMAVALGATTLATLPAANASDWRWRHHHSRHHGSHHGDAVVAGIAGLAAGALIGSALSRPAPYYEPGYYDYDEPRYTVRRRVVVRPAPVRDYGRVSYAGALEPWTRDWYEYCSDRYRSFNARTGTFTGYDGQQHFCVAN